MKNIIITGASGMIGSLLLNKALDSTEVKKVTSIVRKPSGKKHDKLIEIIHNNFLDFSALIENFKNQDVCFYCIGAYTGSVAKDKFREITVGYTEAFAKTLRDSSPEANFCFLSGQGADITEKSTMQFARDKGRAENYLQQLNFKEFHSFRPGYIYPSIPRIEPNVSYKIMKALYKPISKLYANIGLSSTDLSVAMFKVGMNGFNEKILENKTIRRIAGL